MTIEQLENKRLQQFIDAIFDLWLHQATDKKGAE